MPTSFQNGVDGCPADENRTEFYSTNKTLVAADTGKTFRISGGTITFTLPATAVGLVYNFMYTGVNGGGTINVAPVAADGIAAVGSAVVNKALILAAATIKRGDYVTIASLTGATGVTAWTMIGQRGIVTKAP